MAQRRSSEDEDLYADYDDADSIAYAMTERAIKERAWSVEGLLRSLAHKASYEDDGFSHCVVDPELVDTLAQGEVSNAAAIVEQATPELRRWLEGPDVGKQQRARYALVRFGGPLSKEAAQGLAGSIAAQTAVLQALDDPIASGEDEDDDAEPMFPELPSALLPRLRPLLDPRAAKKRARAGASWLDFERIVRLLLRIEADEVSSLLLRAVEVEELRAAVVEQISTERSRGRRLALVSEAVRERFARCASEIEKSRTAGLPSRVEMAIGEVIAALVGRDAYMARRTLEMFDLIPGPVGNSEILRSYVDLLTESIDLLDAEQHLRLASFMTRAPQQRLPAAAAAWVRLDPSKATELARRFHEGDRATADNRWIAAARAHMKWPGRHPAIGALIPESALGVAARNAPSELARPIYESLIRKARNSNELLAAVESAAARAERGVLGPVLEKLRDVPFRLDKTLEGLLPALMGPENEDLVRAEIDGENPFRDRREALERALERALQRSLNRSA